MDNQNVTESDTDKLPVSSQCELLTFDMDKALILMGGKIALLDKMLTMFVSKYQSADFQLNELIDNRNWKEAERFSHSIKGIAANIGADKLTYICAGIEMDLKAIEGSLADTKSFNDDLLSFRMELKKLLSEIDRHKRSKDE